MSTTKTEIAWTDRTWNPIRGCARVSEGCRHCYAEGVAYRFSGPGKPFAGLVRKVNGHPQWTGVIRTVEDALLEPLSWRKPQRVFVNSMSDLFHEDVPDAFIDQVFAVMALAPRHTFQILTKRAERMRAYMADGAGACGRVAAAIQPLRTDRRPVGPVPHLDGGERWWPLPNVWLGVSVEDQKHADARIPLLLQTPAAVRFVSAEPLLGPLDVRRWLRSNDALREHGSHGRVTIRQRDGIDWIIAGGESGAGARPSDLVWYRSLIEQVNYTMGGARLFMKQLGAKPRLRCQTCSHVDGEVPFCSRCAGTRYIALNLRDKKGGDPAEWPEDLRVRQFPEARP
jgi:protein gp37